MTQRPSFLQRQSALVLSIWCIVAAFGAYFCMYGFRKPFTAASYGDQNFGGIGLKTILVTSQVLGYTLSKFIGIKIISEIHPSRRAMGILVLVAISHLGLLIFGFLPAPWSAIGLFLNGLPLGMVFGLVLGSLEGRKMTEALTAGLCASFILADGVTKSVGSELLLVWKVSESWMPFVAGSMFALPLLLFVWMLAQIPPPTEEDIARRSVRAPMSSQERRAFFLRYAFGLTTLVLVYLLVTILRSMRADFAPEIWKGLGSTNEPSVFTDSEKWVALGIVLSNGLVIMIRNNRTAFHVAMGTAMAGLILVGVAVSGLRSGRLDGFTFMVLVGLGMYLPYVAVHTTIFERLIAMTRDRGNIGYLMYLADAFGYLGYVAVMLTKNYMTIDSEMLGFFTTVCMGGAGVGIVLLALCWGYFATRKNREQ